MIFACFSGAFLFHSICSHSFIFWFFARAFLVIDYFKWQFCWDFTSFSVLMESTTAKWWHEIVSLMWHRFYHKSKNFIYVTARFDLCRLWFWTLSSSILAVFLIINGILLIFDYKKIYNFILWKNAIWITRSKLNHHLSYF